MFANIAASLAVISVAMLIVGLILDGPRRVGQPIRPGVATLVGFGFLGIPSTLCLWIIFVIWGI